MLRRLLICRPLTYVCHSVTPSYRMLGVTSLITLCTPVVYIYYILFVRTKATVVYKQYLLVCICSFAIHLS